MLPRKINLLIKKEKMKSKKFLVRFAFAATFIVSPILLSLIPGIGTQKTNLFTNVVVALLLTFSGFTRFFNSESMQKHLVSSMVIIGLLSSLVLVFYIKKAPDPIAYYAFSGFAAGIILGRIANYFSNQKRIFEVGEIVEVFNIEPLPGNDKAPALILGEKYKILKIILDSQGNQHLDLGIVSNLNYVRSYETKEDLPDGNKIHWVHPSRVK